MSRKEGNVVDRRVDRTRRRIKSALAELAGTKPFDEVSVSELAEAADINRVTFYAHFRGVAAAAESVLEDEFRGLEASLPEPAVSAGEDAFSAAEGAFRSALEAFGRRAAFLRWILAGSGAAALRRLLADSIRRLVERRLESLGSPPVDAEGSVYLDFFSEGCAGVLLRWVESDRKESAASLASALAVVGTSRPRDIFGFGRSGGAGFGL